MDSLYYYLIYILIYYTSILQLRNKNISLHFIYFNLQIHHLIYGHEFKYHPVYYVS